MSATTHQVRSVNALRRSGKPMLLTKKGKPEIKLIDAREVARKISAREFERLLEEADVDAGRVEDFDKFIRRFKDARPLIAPSEI